MYGCKCLHDDYWIKNTWLVKNSESTIDLNLLSNFVLKPITKATFTRLRRTASVALYMRTLISDSKGETNFGFRWNLVSEKKRKTDTYTDGISKLFKSSIKTQLQWKKRNVSTNTVHDSLIFINFYFRVASKQ